MKPRILFAIGTFATLSCVIGGTEIALCLESKAKDLFFEQLKNPGEPKNAGIKYRIELRRNGSTTQVDEDMVFRRGDKIRLHVTSNINGYAQVSLRKGSSGKSAILFPTTGECAKVIAGKEFRLPAVGFLEFDDKPGKEVLVVAVTPQASTTSTLVKASNDADSIKENNSELEENVEHQSGKPKDIFYSPPLAQRAKMHVVSKRFRIQGKNAKIAHNKEPNFVNSSFIVCEGSSDLISELTLEHK